MFRMGFCVHNHIQTKWLLFSIMSKNNCMVNDLAHAKFLFCLQSVKKLLHNNNHSTLQLSILGPFQKIELQFIIENNKDV
jgi:hypothetical protein